MDENTTKKPLDEAGSKGVPEAVKVIKEKIDQFAELFESIINKLTETTIDQINEEYSPVIDKHILEKERTEQLTFVAGTFKITLVTSSIFALKLELYYKNKEDQWVAEKNTCSRKMATLTAESRAELDAKKELVFEIDPPKTAEAPSQNADA